MRPAPARDRDSNPGVLFLSSPLAPPIDHSSNRGHGINQVSFLKECLRLIGGVFDGGKLLSLVIEQERLDKASHGSHKKRNRPCFVFSDVVRNRKGRLVRNDAKQRPMPWRRNAR